MAEFDFSDFHEFYPAIIAQMPETFTSHQFILELARQNQTLYVEALYAYRNHLHTDRPAPFLNVHRELSRGLRRFPELVEHVREDAPSKDIFLQDNVCGEWRKILRL